MDKKRLRKVYEKTDGKCHICRKKLAFRNHGRVDQRAPWDVDHLKPRARGGSDRLQNLSPACVGCNRSKQDRSSRSVRWAHGHTRAPLSREAKEKKRATHLITGAGTGSVFGALLGGPVGALVGAGLGLLLGISTTLE